MTDKTGLIDLQKRQHKHDRDHHEDIFNISYPNRMNHYVLHFSKYVGRLSKTGSDRDELERTVSKTLADSTIVTLAAANTLNIDLRKHLTQEFGVDSEAIGEIAGELAGSKEEDGLDEVRNWLFTSMALPAGRMADAMESLDHMEPMNTRQILEEETVAILANLLIASDQLNVDLERLLHDRWTEIEEESIL